MPKIAQRITNCLWFDHQAEEAAQFYCGIFPNSRIGPIASYTEVGQEHHRKPPGSTMVVEFTLDGQRFVAMNGGPLFSFNLAISLMVHVEDQAELDHYWNALSAGGDPAAQQCGWLKDRYGLSWQIVSTRWMAMVNSPDTEAVKRGLQALYGMKKLDLAALQRAFDGR